MWESCMSSNCSGYLSGPIGGVFTSSVQLLLAAQCLLGEKWPEDGRERISSPIFDYIIIGAGSAGSVLASRLSEDTDRTVLLIEAGGDPPFESEIINGMEYLIGTQYDWNYKTENDLKAFQGLVGGKFPWPRGKAVGGSSSINALIYIRGHKRNFDNLEKLGNIGWNYEDALKYFKKSENLSYSLIRNDQELQKYHHFSGFLGVGLLDSADVLDEYYIRAFEELGYNRVIDINVPENYGIVKMVGTIQDGKRESTARAFLVPARERKNLFILKNTLATKIVFDNKKAIGVKLMFDNKTEAVFEASREVIVSAGTINTPQLLMLSGVGPKDHLYEMDIPIVNDLSVGKNLHDHPEHYVFMTLDTPYDLEPIMNSSENILNVAKFITKREGSFSQFISSSVSTFVNVNNEPKTFPPNIQFQQICFGKKSTRLKNFINDYNEEIKNSIIEMNKNRQVILMLINFLEQQSRGNIKLASKNPLEKPKIHPNYFDVEDDVETVLKAIDVLYGFANTSTMKIFHAEIPRVKISACDLFDYPSKEYWRCNILHISQSAYHPMGTAKMGPKSDPEAVVNSNLQVHGLHNLRVVDASILPGAISANTNAAVIMLAEKASDIIKAAHKST